MADDRASDFTQSNSSSWSEGARHSALRGLAGGEASDEELRAALENLDLAVLVRTLDGHVVMINAAFVRLLGYPREEVVGQDIRRFLCPEGQRAIDETDEKIRNGQVGGLTGTIQMACRDETILRIRVSVTTIVRNGQTFVVSILQDWSDILWEDPSRG